MTRPVFVTKLAIVVAPQINCAIVPNTASGAATVVPIPVNPLPLEWLLQERRKVDRTRDLEQDSPAHVLDRILSRLLQLEIHETDVWERENYRQAFITLTLASRGNTIPFICASYQMYGLHPDKVWPAIVAKREWLLRPTGAESPIQIVSAPVPKIPPHSEKKERAA